MYRDKRKPALLLAACVTAGLFAGCGKEDPVSSPSPPPETPSPTPPPVSIPLELPAREGKVYFLNSGLETEEMWQELAGIYRRQTGVRVDVVTAGSDRYESVLKTELGKPEAPALFQCAGPEALEDLKDFCMELDETALVQEVASDVFLLKDETPSVRAVGYSYEAFGLLVNVALLEYAGHSLQEITNFDTLKAVADDIHANAESLGFDAFSPAGLDMATSGWRFSNHLANLPLFYEFRDGGVDAPPAGITGQYLDNFKQVWDLYLTDSAAAGEELPEITGNDSEAAFGRGEAVFYQNGSWEYPVLTGKYHMDPGTLAILPLYCGVEGEELAGLCCGARGWWSVNAKASEADRQAALDFLTWAVTSEEGTSLLARQFGGTPFRSAKPPENVFLAQANDSLTWGRYTIPWVYSWTPSPEQWRSGVIDALAGYSAGTGEWSDVEAAFVDAWAELYRKETRG